MGLITEPAAQTKSMSVKRDVKPMIRGTKKTKPKYPDPNYDPGNPPEPMTPTEDSENEPYDEEFAKALEKKNERRRRENATKNQK